MMSNQKRALRRSRSDRMLAGVCGGLAQFFRYQCILVPAGYGHRVHSRRRTRDFDLPVALDHDSSGISDLLGQMQRAALSINTRLFA